EGGLVFGFAVGAGIFGRKWSPAALTAVALKEATMHEFSNTKILVVGGAGFVGSTLVQSLLSCSPREVIVVDNLLSAERCHVPQRPDVRFVDKSITDDAVLRHLPDDVDYVFHLATFHGNQNSIADPLGDHENNTLTTLKLFERIKAFKNLKKVVYSSAGCTV